MTKTLAEARAWAAAYREFDVPPGVQPFVVPAHTSLAVVRDTIGYDNPIRIGAQNAYWNDDPAHTGEVSVGMVRDAGASMLEVGHSERRAEFADSDEVVSLKTRAAHQGGLLPLVCVGESQEVRDSGAQLDFVTNQVRSALSNLDEGADVLLAYEPIWAIGVGGRPAQPDEVAPVLTAMAAAVPSGVNSLGVLYGGSVRPDNAALMLRETTASGLFAGRSAWNIEGFGELLEIVGQIAAERG